MLKTETNTPEVAEEINIAFLIWNNVHEFFSVDFEHGQALGHLSEVWGPVVGGRHRGGGLRLRGGYPRRRDLRRRLTADKKCHPATQNAAENAQRCANCAQNASQ